MSPVVRFRVGCDRAQRLFFVRDIVTGVCSGVYVSATEALHVARRANRALAGAK